MSANFSIRIVTVDTYTSRPVADLDASHSDFGSPSARVPIIRVFGSTPAGQTVCMHVHRVFPYFYVPYDGTLPADRYIQQFAASLDHALNLFGGDTDDTQHGPGGLPTSAARKQHVFKVSLVKGRPFYGYYQSDLMYLKIYFYSSQSVKRATKLLLSGAVMRKKFQPYESHIPYVLQFFMDYNLQGMNFLNVSAWQTRPVNEAETCSERVRLREADGLGSQDILIATTYHAPNTNLFTNFGQTNVNTLKRISTCELEVDVVSDDILNREEIEIKLGTNPGLEAIWRDENQRRAMRGLPPLNNVKPSQERHNVQRTKTEEFFELKLAAKLAIPAERSEPVAESPEAELTKSPPDSSGLMHGDSLVEGVPVSSLQEDFPEVNSSFFLDRHNGSVLDAGDRRTGFASPVLIDEDQINALTTEPEHTDATQDLVSILRDLQMMADESGQATVPDADTSEILRGDDDEMAEMSKSAVDGPVELDFDSIASPDPVVDGESPSSSFWIPCNQEQLSVMETIPSTLPEALMDAEPPVASLPKTSIALEPHVVIMETQPSGLPVESARSARVLDQESVVPHEAVACRSSSLASKEKGWDAELHLHNTCKRRVTFAVDVDDKPSEGTGSTPAAPFKRSKMVVPAVPFPTTSDLIKSASNLGMPWHSNSTTYYSDVAELIFDLKGTDDAPGPEPGGSDQMEDMAEFDSSVIRFKSSGLFRLGYQTREDDLEEEDNEASENVRGAENVARKSTAVPRKRWTVMLTPAISFPDLSHSVRLRERLARRKRGQVDAQTQPKTASAELDFYDIENGKRKGKSTSTGTNHSQKTMLTSSKGSLNSAKKAKGNKYFQAMVANNFDTPLTKKTQKQNDGKSQILHESENLILMSLELHADVRKMRYADPRTDPVRFVAYTLMTDTGEGSADRRSSGIYVDPVLSGAGKTPLGEREFRRLKIWLSGRVNFSELDVEFVASEEDLFEALISRVRSVDPDVLVGYEVQMSSWGYVIERGIFLGVDMLRLLSRLLRPVGNIAQKRRVPRAVADYEARKMSEHHIVGRVILNLWRILRQEVNLTIYSLENVLFHVLKLRFHLYSVTTLTDWFLQPAGDFCRWRAVEYLIMKSSLNAALLYKLDVIRQTSEFSRLFGIQFYETLTRGSQWRVESMMLRLAKPYSYVPVSPSGDQLKGMAAPESLPLIIEPESRFYQDPVLVLDFQSLYPSMVIAYNYCYSTCLGKVEYLGSDTHFKFGCTSLRIPTAFVKQHLSNLHFTPNGVAFVNKSVRTGILPTMLEEILNTRIMVKKSMADYKDNPTLKKLLHARQLGLKLIANVTFGYTSASFSGRMPCVEIGDTIVAKGRETLELAMQYIEAKPEWRAHVLYGDTDSMFVILPGRNKDEAFRIGREMEKAITALNPKPVKLKFEKVYKPCILQTKKRYCGFMYESEDQVEPVFDAKGIETVRRDTCPLVSKTLERMIRLLFAPRCDVLSVKQYVQKQFFDVLSGEINMQDLVFAKEYRGRETYKPGAAVPALEIAKRLTSRDPRAEPRAGERVPYIITYGNPSETLLSLVRQPHEVFLDPSLKPHGYYYCSRQLVPVLNRVLLLMGIDSRSWLREVEERALMQLLDPTQPTPEDLLVFQRFCAAVLRGNDSGKSLLGPDTVVPAGNDGASHERSLHAELQVCHACMGTRGPAMECVSFDCPVLFRLHRSTCGYARNQAARGLFSVV